MAPLDFIVCICIHTLPISSLWPEGCRRSPPLHHFRRRALPPRPCLVPAGRWLRRRPTCGRNCNHFLPWTTKRCKKGLHFHALFSIIKCVRFGQHIWVWRSLVACLNGVQEAGGSSPLTQTRKQTCCSRSVFYLACRPLSRLSPARCPPPTPPAPLRARTAADRTALLPPKCPQTRPTASRPRLHSEYRPPPPARASKGVTPAPGAAERADRGQVWYNRHGRGAGHERHHHSGPTREDARAIADVAGAGLCAGGGHGPHGRRRPGRRGHAAAGRASRRR